MGIALTQQMMMHVRAAMNNLGNLKSNLSFDNKTQVYSLVVSCGENTVDSYNGTIDDALDWHHRNYPKAFWEFDLSWDKKIPEENLVKLRQYESLWIWGG